ncbi:MAG: hypothetical protein KF767_05475 [Bdellovibrionaceae bacterium]|nr:hypothetical protein [Pseudobdellovibrionaceae bacterium]
MTTYALIFALILGTSATLPAYAETTAADDVVLKTLKRELRKAQKSCPKLDCPSQSLQVVPLTSAQVRELGTERRARLRQVTKAMALDLWPDTVLEGPYQVQFRMRLDHIEFLTRNGEQIGYRLSFSDKAWNTDDCRPKTSNTQNQLKDCETGRVHDAGFVLNDLKTTTRDEGVNPTYIADPPARRPAQADLSLNPAKRKALSSYARVNLPLTNPTCDARAVKETIARHQSQIVDLIYDERGLWICDDHERSANCYEESSLAILLGQLEPVENLFGPSQSYRTDPNYALCERNDNCLVRLRFTCMQPELAVELE